jgi:hypothetical protein
MSPSGAMSNVNSEQFYSQWTKDNYKTMSYMASDAIRSVNSKPDKKKKNLQHYTFGGFTNIRKTPLYYEMAPNKFNIEPEHNFSSEYDTGREQLTGYGGQTHTTAKHISLQRPMKPKVPNFFDQAYGTNLIKRVRERPQS